MSGFWGPFTQQPNILILLTDQQRSTQHFPKGWDRVHLPNLTRLKASGVTFPNAMTNTTGSIPACRALFTSTFPTLGKISQGGDGPATAGQPPRPIATLWQILRDTHLLPNGIRYEYGPNEDTGQDSQNPLSTVDQATTFLRKYRRKPDRSNPFLLAVSLKPPHQLRDVLSFAQVTPDQKGKFPWKKAPFTQISLPDTYHLSADQRANKPLAQTSPACRPDFDEATATEYLRFYAYLETQTDILLGKVMAAFHANPDNDAQNTLIVRLANHGEMAMAQGGMRGAERQTYNESLLVPLIFANPGLPQGGICEGLAGLIDVLPSLTELSGIAPAQLEKAYAIQGRSLAPALLPPGCRKDGDAPAQLLFATDSGAHIRSLVDSHRWNAKYSVYYRMTKNPENPNGKASNFEFEMYDFTYNGATRCWNNEAHNLLPLYGHGPVSSLIEDTWVQMHAALCAKLQEKAQMPANWPMTVPLS